ncbi:MAG: biotin--[acetyl-CoA-carboxylase] ligase [Bacteroidetes bacterium]|nr:MAG: biotin--[acetyl-CoA-carboxylase] ligase [Bacteroidota bacterium]
MNANISQITSSSRTITRIYLPYIGSTNDYAMNLLRTKNMMSETLIVTDFQTEGKGQRGKHWVSRPGKDLCLSWVLKNPPKHPTVFNMACALSVLEGIRKVDSFSSRLSIKWPNDILYSTGNLNLNHSKKLAGILIENHWRGEIWTAAIVGIGINVGRNNKIVGEKYNFPSQIAEFALPPISVAEILETEIEPSILELPILEALHKRIQTLNRDNGVEKTVEDFNSELFGLNQSRQFDINGKIRYGKLLRVDKDGRGVFVWDDNGKTSHLNSSEVVWCWD